MFRPASRTLLRAALRTATPTSRVVKAPGSFRLLSTAPPAQRSRSWKSAALRWGAAGGIVYWYNTTNVFAEELDIPQPPESHHDTEPLPTVDSLAARRKASRPAADVQVADGATTSGPLGDSGAAPGSPEELEQEAGQQGAFNEETGEINWDCPCLGGMAHGPCGENFKEAFSCFVFSQEEPKGVDCIEKFKGMQDCFRQHPDIYGAELEDDDDYEEGEEREKVASHDAAVDSAPPKTSTSTATPPPAPTPTPVDLEKVSSPPSPKTDTESTKKTERAQAATEQVKKDHEPTSESEELVPKAWHDAK